MYNVLVITWEWGREVVDNRSKGKVAAEMNREEVMIGSCQKTTSTHVYHILT